MMSTRFVDSACCGNAIELNTYVQKYVRPEANEQQILRMSHYMVGLNAT